MVQHGHPGGHALAVGFVRRPLGRRRRRADFGRELADCGDDEAAEGGWPFGERGWPARVPTGSPVRVLSRCGSHLRV